MGNVGLAIISIALTTIPLQAVEVDEAAKVSGSEGGKQVLNEALKVSKTKPALSVAAGITCLACIPAAKVTARLTMCIACCTIITKVLG